MMMMMSLKRKDMWALVGIFLIVEGVVQVLGDLLNLEDSSSVMASGFLRIVIGAILWYRNTDAETEKSGL